MATEFELTKRIRREVATALAPFEKKLEAQDEWINGLFMAFEDLMQALLKENPALVQQAVKDWRCASDHYDLAGKGLYQSESRERLQPRKMLYRMLLASGALEQLEA